MGARLRATDEGELWGQVWEPLYALSHLETEECAVARCVEAVLELCRVCAQRPVDQGRAAPCGRPTAAQ